MPSDFELVKISLHNANELVNMKNNPVVDSVLLAPVRALPIIGDLIDSSTNKLLDNYQKEKEEELANFILKNGTLITSSMVNDVEFIINFNRVIEAIRRLATNDKVEFFGNLIRNGYLSGNHIDSNLFDEYLNTLNTMSYREIQYLVDYKLYCEEKSKNEKRNSKKIKGKVSYCRWGVFSRDYTMQNNITRSELSSAFMRIKQTGFVDEIFETESGDVDEDLHSFNSLNVESSGFCIESSFLTFFDIVLKLEE